MRSTRPLICATSIAAFVFALGTAPHSGRAENYYWDGSFDSSWAGLDNWTLDPASSTGTPTAVPGGSDIAIFNFTGGTPANQISTLGANRGVGGIVFDSNSTAALTIGTVNDFTLTLGASGFTTNAGAAAHIFNSAVTLGATQTWTSNSSNALTINGNFTTGANCLNIAGTGTGGFVLGGSVSVNGASTWTNNSAAAFKATGNVSLSNTLTLAGSGGFTFSTGTIQVAGGNRSINVNATGPVSFGNIDTHDGTARALTFNVAEGANPVVNGVISDSGAVIKSGRGTLTFNGANSFSSTVAGLTIEDGTVNVNTANTTNPRLNMGGVAGGSPILNLDAAYRVENIVYNASNNPNGAVINGTANGSIALYNNRTVIVGDSTNADHDLTINVPITNGDATGRNLVKQGAGTLVLNAANTFSGTFQLEGGKTIINAGNTNTGGATVFNNATGSIATTLTISEGVQYRLPSNLQVNSTAANGAVIDGSGTIGIHGGDRAIIVADTAAENDLVISVGLANSAVEAAGTNRGFRKEQTGRLVLQGANTYTGLTDVARGTLVLDYSLNNGDNKLSNSANTQLRGGTLVLIGNASADTTETLGTGKFRLSSGTSTVSLQSTGKALTFNIGDIDRSIGEGVIDFRTNDANLAVYQTTEANNSLGFLGAYATFNGDRWAANDGTGRLTAFTGSVVQNDRSQWQAGQHVVVDGALTGAIGVNRIGSLIVDAAVNTFDLNNPARALTIDSGGILISGDVGANDTTITSGQLLVPGLNGASRSMVITNRSAGVLTVDASLGGNHQPMTTTQEVTIAGTGQVVLAGRNFQNGDINIHTRVRLSGGNAINDFAGVVLGNGGEVELDLNGTSEGIGNLSGGTSTNISSSAVNLGVGGILTLNQTASSTYSGGIIGSGKVIKQGSGTFTTNSGTALTYTGDFEVLGGSVDLLGDHDGLLNVSTILVRGGQIRSGQDYSASRNKFANTATIRLEGTSGNGLRVSSNQNATRTESVDKLDLTAGANTITIANTAGTPTAAVTTLAFTNTTDAFVRSNNATLLVRGDALGAATTVTRRTGVTFANGIADMLVGPGTTAGSKNLRILPFAAGSNTAAGVGDSFVTFDSTLGLRPLDIATEYATSYATAGVTDNVSLSATGTNLATATFNALRVDNSAGNVDLTGAGGGSNTLTLTSGALLVSAGANANDTVISGFNKILAGTSAAGDDELVVRITSSNAAAANAVLTINSSISDQAMGGGKTHLTKAGDGTLVLGGTNTYSGDTTINDGVLEFGSAANFGSSTLIRNAGGTLRWGTGNTTDITTNATVELLGASTYLTSGAGSITSAGAVFDVGANNVTLANAIGNNGAGGLTKTGSGTLTLAAAPTYKGATLVTQGALNFQTIAPNTTRALYILSESGTVSSTVANGLSVDSLMVGGVYAGTTSGTGTLTVNAGPVSIGNGTGEDLLMIGVRASNAGTPVANSKLAGLVDLRNASSVTIDVSDIRLGFIASDPGTSNTTPNAKGELFLPTSASAVNTITANTITIGNAPVGVVNTAAPSKIDLGGGSTTMNVNTLVIGGTKSDGSIIMAPGASFTLRGAGGGNTTANVFLGENDNGTGSTSTNGKGLLDLTDANADLKINLLTLGRLSHTTSTGSGRGTLTFNMGTIEASTIRMADANFNGSSGATNHAATAGIINQGGGTLRFADLSKGSGTATFNWNGGTVGNLANTNLVNQNVSVSLNGATTRTFDVTGSQTATFQSAAGFIGDGGFTKTGTGTLALDGTNTHTGPTTVDNGTLLVGGSITASIVSVNTGVLGGTGTITSAVTIGNGSGASDAMIAPGKGGIGTLSTGAVTMNSDAVFALEINVANATTVTSDLLTSSGPLTLSLASSPGLHLTNLGSDTALTLGTVIPFLTYSGGWNGGFFSVGGNVITDYSAGGPLSTFTIGANTFAIDYDAGGNTAALVAVVPEPGTASLALVAFGTLLGFRRARRQSRA